MVEKVHGLIPELGDWVEGELTFVSKTGSIAADDALVLELQQIGTIVILNEIGGVVHAALGHAAGDALPAGWTVGEFSVA